MTTLKDIGSFIGGVIVIILILWVLSEMANGLVRPIFDDVSRNY